MRLIACCLVFLSLVGHAETPVETMEAFARSADSELWYPTTCGEPMSAYGYGDSTPGSVRASIAAAVVFDTLGKCDVPERKRWSQLGESAFLYLWYAHEKGEFRCADGKTWKPLGRFGFTEEITGLADERRTAAKRSESDFFPWVPVVPRPPRGRYDRCAAAVEKAYAASCASRGVNYVPVGADIRDGGRLGLVRGRAVASGELKKGDWILDTRIAETGPLGEDEGVHDVLRRQMRIRRLADGRIALVRECVTAVKACELPFGFRAVPYAADCVRVLSGEAKAADGAVSLRDGEVLYDVTYAVNADADKAALAKVVPVVLKLPVTTQPDDESDVWQAKIDAASAAGGGRVVVPAGDHVVAELELKDNVTLELAEGARLVAVTNDAAYRWTVGIKAELQKTGVVVAYGATNVALVGKGTIDGRGDTQPLSYSRPVKWRSVFLYQCRGVRIAGVTLANPSFWSCFLRECEDVHVKGLTIRGHSNYNNDGLDLCVANALVEDCDIDTDDDAMVIKNFNPDWDAHDVEIRNCRISSNAAHIKFGTETFGPMRRYDIHHCELLARTRSLVRNDVGDPTWPGLTDEPNGSSGFTLLAVDGGLLEDVRIHDITMRRGVRVPFCGLVGRRNGEENWGRSTIRNLTLERVVMTDPAVTGVGCFLKGLETNPIENVVIRDCSFKMMASPGAEKRLHEKFPENASLYPWAGHFNGPVPGSFLFLRRARNVRMENVKVEICGEGEKRPVLVTDDDPSEVSVSGCDFGVFAR